MEEENRDQASGEGQVKATLKKTAPPVTEPKPEAAEAVTGPGWLRELASGTYHEVEEVQVILSAYPNAYEVVQASEVDKSKVGFEKPD